MKNFLIFAAILSSLSLGAQQKEQKKMDPDNSTTIEKNKFGADESKATNYFTGGSVSFGLSSYGFNAGLHPHFGYTINKYIDVAVVTNFEYISQRDQYDNKYHNTTYGLGAFARLYPVRFAFIQIQPEYNFTNFKFIQNGGVDVKSHSSVPSLLLGIGYIPGRSDKNTFSYFTLMVDVLKKDNSPYLDGNGRLKPIIRAGYNIGLFRNRGNR